jgi:ferredoxin
MSDIGRLFERLSSVGTLYLPIEGGGQTAFAPWRAGADVQLDRVNTDLSVKGLFFPQTEDIAFFKREGKKISVLPSSDPDEPFAVFGVRACDVRGLEVLDKVFLDDPAHMDTFYKGRRENGALIALACSSPAETCFCGAFGVDLAEPSGDVAAWIVDNTLYWEAKTQRGERLTEAVRPVMAEQSGTSAVDASKKAARDALAAAPLASLKDSLSAWGANDMLTLFSSPLWANLSMSCVGCGTCTYVCPTCQCYDVQDFDTGHGVTRFRCWDSCMYSDFTLMASGNPRKTQLERFRQRFMHKLVYFPEKYGGMFSCTGCGRCLSKCPVSMNIAKVIKAVGGVENG